MTSSAPQHHQIGHILGRLAEPTRSREDDRRIDLVNRLVRSRPQSGADWVEAWRETSVALAENFFEWVDAALSSAAEYSRLPASRLMARRPTDADRTRLIGSLVAEGFELERLAERVPSDSTDRAWGVALEGAWDRSEAVLRRERRRWQVEVDTVRTWRRSWRPLLITGVVALPLATLLAAWLGGWLAAPEWFAPIGRAFWSLPWP